MLHRHDMVTRAAFLRQNGVKSCNADAGIKIGELLILCIISPNFD
jgi:hypothetical protein